MQIKSLAAKNIHAGMIADDTAGLSTVQNDQLHLLGEEKLLKMSGSLDVPELLSVRKTMIAFRTW